jgi:hypothetical protein
MNNNLETIRIFSEDVIPVYDTDTGEKVACGYLSYEADEYGDLRPYLCDNGKIVMRDVNDWMPMPNVTSVLKK